MLNKTHITALAWLRAVKLAPPVEDDGWPELFKWCSHSWDWGFSWALTNSGVIKCPDEPRVAAPSFSLTPEVGKLEIQVLRGLKALSRSEVRLLWPGPAAHFIMGLPSCCQASNVKPQRQNLSHIEHIRIQQTQMHFILVNLKRQFAKLRLKISKILKATHC